jgi:hypothetical protein
MTTYFFDLLAQEGWIADDDGTSFSEVSAAMEHARVVAHELMRGAERSRRHWRLRVRDEKSVGFGELVFASVDPTLDNLRPRIRTLIENVSWGLGELTQRAIEMDGQRYEFRALLARLRRQPFLVATGGHRVATIDVEPESGPIVLPPRLVASGRRSGEALRGAGLEPGGLNVSWPVMDRHLALQHLAQAQRHVTDGERYIHNQRRIIAQVEQRGDDPAESKRLLALFEVVQKMHVADRDRLADECAKREA